MDGRDRPIFHDALAAVENASSARRLAVQKTIETFGVEMDNPVAHDLHSGAAGPGRVRARAAVVNRGQRRAATRQTIRPRYWWSILRSTFSTVLLNSGINQSIETVSNMGVVCVSGRYWPIARWQTRGGLP